MIHLLICLLLLFFVICVHLAWCRIRRKEDLQVNIFIWCDAIGLIIYLITGKLWSFGETSLFGTAAVIYILLSILYLFFYCATAIDSPSSTTLRLVSENKQISFKQLIEKLGGNYFIISRLEALVEHGLVEHQDQKYFLTKRGVMIAKLLNFYQKISAREIGG